MDDADARPARMYEPGQRWRLAATPDLANATVLILRVDEPVGDTTVVHIRLDGFSIENPLGGPPLTSLPHAPFASDALDRSLTELIRSDEPLPAFEEGYEHWKQAKGGHYTISPAELPAILAETIASGTRTSG